MSESLLEKKARLRRLLEKREETSVPEVEPRRRSPLEPLSFAQKSLWFIAKLEGPNPAHNIPILLRLSGRLDVDALSRAVSAMVRRHDALRTYFVEQDGVPYQALAEPHDVRLEPQPVAPEEAEAAYSRAAQLPYDMADDHLFRVSLFSAPSEHFALVVTMHHSVSDAWSAGRFLRELVAFYEAYSSGRDLVLEPLAVTYADYVHWEKQWLESGVLERQLLFWKSQLADLPAQPMLPTDRPRKAVQSHRGGTAHFTVPAALLERLKSLSTEQKCSLFVALRAALAILLHRYSSREDFAIGTGLDNRRRPELEGLIGYFVNILPIRARVTGEQPFTAVLRAARDAVLQALVNQDVPYHRILEELRPERIQGQQRPLFEVLFILQNVPYQRRVELPGLWIEAEVPDSGAAKFDLSIALQEDAGRLLGQIEYRSDLFDAITVQRLAASYVRLLREAVAHPELRAGEMGLLDAAERHQLLVEWNDAPGAEVGEASREEPAAVLDAAEERRLRVDLNRAERTWARPVTVQELFAQQAARSAERAAAVGPDGSMTYRELAERSAALAAQIRRLLANAGIDHRVGLLADPDPQILTGMLGILAAGCGFVPLDPRAPDERLAWTLEDCACEVLVTQRRHLARMVPLARGSSVRHVICLDGETGANQPEPALDGSDPRALRSLAYVVYTSGSTGRPKGVEVSHESLVPMLLWGCGYFGLGEGSRVLQSLSYCFDFGIFEHLTTVLAGGTLYFPGEAAGDPAAFAREIARLGINTLHTTPAFARELAAAGTGGALEGLEIVHLGGEALARGTVARIREVAPRTAIYNGYGPTEATVNSAIFRLGETTGEEWTVVPIGRRSADNALYVLDRSGRLVPFGARGELCVGGIGVARGYRNRPDLTAERFVPDPFGDVPGGRLYRTGDLVRYLPEGALEFLGRIDEQVKIRGFRVEPGEVEAVLREHPEVREAAVLARPEPSGDLRLVAYVVAGRVAAPELRSFLGQRLPPHMVPPVFVALAALPLTSNGKLDRRALPAPGDSGDALSASTRTVFGRPAPGVRAYVLGRRFDALLIGGSGELCLGGAEVRHGSLGRPDVTAARFVPDPFAGIGSEPGARLFRTGDLARHRADGVIEILGRLDSGGRVLAEAPDRPAAYVAPRTELERRLCTIWEEVLGAERVGIEDDFFELGGHSLLAMRAVSLMRAALDRELPLRMLFESPTVAGLCARLPELTGDRILPPIEVLAEREGLPLSYAQQRLWFIDRLEGGSSHYNISGWALVRGGLDTEAFGRAIRSVVARHEALRTVFREVDGEAVQIIREKAGLPLEETDLSGLEEAEREAEVRRLVFEDARWPFDLSRDVLLRVRLITLSDEQHAVSFCMHHIGADGWSGGVLMRELGALYAAYREGRESPLPPLRVQYADYAQWQRQWLRGALLETELSYWRGRLAGLPLIHSLPLDRPRPARQGFAGGAHVQTLRGERRDRLEAFCRESGVTLFMFLHASFAALLSRYSQAADIVIGAPIAGRVHPDLEPLIGFFVNTLVLRSDLTGDLAGGPRFSGLLASSRQTTLDAYAHQHVPFEMLVEDLKPERSLSYSPLFQISLALLQVPPGDPALRLEWMGEGSGIVKFDLELNVREHAEELVLDWWYKQELFDAATVERLASSFGVLLDAVLEKAQEPVQALPLLTEAERLELLAAGRGREAALPRVGGAHELFEAQAERSPDAVAMPFAAGPLTYRELNERANRLAHALIRQGVRAETLVGLCAERSPEMVIGLLGILKAGGAYLPLDPRYPEARLRYMLEDSGAELALAQGRIVESAFLAGCRALALDDPGLAAEPADNPETRVRPDDLAYVIYTSGSTGQPKGVMVEHGQLVQTLTASLDELGWDAGDRMLCLAPFSFDIFLFELLSPLLAGGRCELVPLSPVLDLERVAAQLPELTRLHAVPALMTQIVELAERSGSRFPRLRTLFVGGEAVPAELLVRMREVFPEAELRVLYGPTETAIIATSWRVEAGHRPSGSRIGRPLSNVEIRVCDPLGSPAPVGVAGEILIGGPGVARGYLGRPDLTAERFIAHPELPGTRLYRTGDLARWRGDGTLEFLGRLDDQVKIRGFRIELGEIEAQLRSRDEVRDAVVLARQDRPGEKRLVAYVVGREGSTLDPQRLREHLAARLPDYMVPPVLLVLDELPLTANGKVDRAALPAPEPDDVRRSTYVAPRTELESRLCEIWAEVLGLERIGIAESFFDLGGHSLLATRVVSRVRSVLGRELPLRALFEHPAIGDLCDSVPELGGGVVLPEIEVLAQREGLPLSYAQQRLWFIDRLEGGSRHYNIAGAGRALGDLDREAFARALQTIVARHEPLRTVFQEVAGEVVQVIRRDVLFHLETRDLSGLDAEEREREVRRLAGEDARRPFDLTRDLMLRAELLKLSGQEHAVLLNMHHIASDGWSMGVLVQELGALYTAYRAGGETPLPPLRVQYADYGQWQRQWLRGELLEEQMGHWRRELAGLPQVHSLPLDHPRPVRQGFEGGLFVQRLGRDLKERIAARCRQSGVTLFMFLEAAFAVLLSRYSRERDIVVGTPVAGRVHRDLEPLIGFFVNTLVLRSDLSATPRFVESLEAGKQTILDAYAHQHVPFEMLVEELAPERSLGHSPLFQIVIVLQNAERGEVALGDARFEPMPDGSGVVRFDLELNLSEARDELAAHWSFRKDLFDGVTVERMASSFAVLLEGIADRLEERVEDLPLLTGAEIARLSAWDGTAVAYPRDVRIHELFEAQVERSPEAVAVVLGDRRLTYAELDEQANRLAHHLIGLGVGDETLVGLCMERSLEMAVGLLAILKAGGAYVPLDPEYPEARLATMVDDTGVAVVLTQSRLAGMSCFAGRHTVPLDDPALALPTSSPPPALPGLPGQSSGLAYVIYTSGSTGQPKGAMVEHRSVVRLVIHSDFVPLNAGTVMLQASSVSFDAATLEIWGPLLNGGRLVLYPERVPEIGKLNAEIERHGVNTAWLTAGLFEQWSHQVPRTSPLRWVLAGGDVLDPLAVVRVYAALPEVEVVNGYGPTENTTFTSCYSISRGLDPREALPLGRPIHGTGVVLLQENRTLAALGAVGELHALGDGVARGYLNRPELTAERFPANPHSGVAGARLYRTGDLARWRADGMLEFLGRQDGQVKIRGFRVELGEIEAQLRSEESVREAVVLAREDRPGEKRLVAYVVGREGWEPEAGRLREHLASRLPDHMVPSVFVMLGALPLTANGKVDRRALPAPEEEDYQRGGYIAPRTELERGLCAIWEELLGVERVGIADGFFDLGGHSLLATRMVSRVRAELHREIPLRSLFENPTVEGLCEALADLGGGWILPEIEVLELRENLPLSYAQQRLWFIDRLEGGSSHYNIPAGVRLRGPLEARALAGALRTVVDRHESLRTVFREANGRPVQMIRTGVSLAVPVCDLSGLAAEQRESEVQRLAWEDARRPFDLGRDLLLRAALLKLADEEHAVLFNMHHIASDGWSMNVLMRELGPLYEACRAGERSPLPPLRVQYADYAQWQRQWLQDEILETQLSYWREQLYGLPLVHSLPLDKPRPARQGFEGGEHVQRLGLERKERLAAACRTFGVTPFMFLEAAFAALLGRYSHETDVVVGSPIAGRFHRDIEPLIGLFVNTLVLRSDLSGDPRFSALLEASKLTILDAYAHQHVPLEMLVEELRPERSLSHSPLFQILLVFQNHEPGGTALGETQVEPLDGAAGFVKLDLELNVLELEDELVLYWMYKKELFEAATVERMAAGFGELLAGCLENPAESIQELPLLTAVERRLLAAWQGGEEPHREHRSVREQFEAQVEQRPDEVAVVLGGGRLTYRELNERANRLAHALIRQGVRAETLVGLCAERSLEMLVGLLGIFKAGGAYVPLDPQYPEARLRYMIADSGVALVLTQSQLAEPGFLAGCRAVPLDDPGLAVEPAGNPQARDRSSDLAYVIYTSGSTGQPKGVMIEQGQLAHTLAASLAELGWDAADRMLCLAPFSFDIFLFELLSPLLAGGRCELVPLSPSLDIDRLVALLPELTRLHAVPALMTQLVELAAAAGIRCPGLRTLFVGGDAVPADLLARMREVFPAAELQVLYGPTETSIIATSWRVEAGQRPSGSRIGRPLPGVEIRVCDHLGNPVPVGVNGEIRIGGPGVARGYLGRESLTAERFVARPDAQAAGARSYRTGDLARWRGDGTLEFMGRLDHQVKIRGFRIELGEIEALLGSHAAVSEVVVLAREDRPGEKRLVAYVVGKLGSTPDPERLHEHIASKLPEYMVPAAFVVLDWLPLTANGKVDRKALPAPEVGDFQRGEYVAPRTELERRLCEMWAELLGVEQVGIEDNFFDLGGHSLLATQVVSQIRSALGLELPLRAVFENPTVAGLCGRLPELRGGPVLPPIEVLAQREGLPLSYAQQRLWFIERLEGASSQYNIPAAMRVEGGLDEAALARALRTIVERHESLRTVFRDADGAVVQVIRDNADFRLVQRDLSRLEPEEMEREVRRLALEDARKPFDLEHDLLLRATLLKRSEQKHMVLLNMHHIASDGWSMGVLLRELGALYEAYRAGEESPLPPLPVQYADYAHWQRQWLQGEALESQLSYWRHQLAALPPVHGLPLDRPRPARQGFEGGYQIQHLTRDLRDRLDLRCQECGVTLFMLLEAAFSVLLGRYSRERDIVLGSPIAGRVHRDVEPLIGFFINTLVLRNDLSGNPRFSDLLAASKQTILDAYAHQHVPFEMLVEELKPERSLGHGPLFQVLFVLQNAERSDAGLPGSRLESVGGESGVVRFDLELSAWNFEHSLDLSWLYKKELFDGATIGRMASSFAVLLEGIAERLEERVEDLPLLTEAEQKRLTAWDGGAAAYPRDVRIHELFEAQAERTPEAVAVELAEQRLSYAELNEWANRLAHHLSGLGVGQETLVGLCMERSLEMVAGILGILKAGGAYVPLDPEYPEARLAAMVEDAALEVVLAGRRLAERDCFSGCRTVVLDDTASAGSGNLHRPGRSSDLAYVIYTSGSTGQPKGVMVEHRSVVRLVIQPDYLPLDAGTVMLQASSVSFDAATLEIWGPLLNGGRLVLYPERVPEIEKLNATIERHGVNTAWLTAGLFEPWSYQVPAASPLRWVLSGGDVVDPLAVARVYAALPEVLAIDGYGPTENTTFTSCHSIPRGFDPHQALPLGRPIRGTGVYLLQENGALAALGAVGELYALGDGVARGYLSRPELTAERFVVNPYGDEAGGRLYRTGDLARWRVAGTLEFLGREDGQVKIRGFRVELGEIETQLRFEESVKEAVVVVREDRPGEKRLVAYVVGREGLEPEAGRLRDHLASRLPDHMVPQVFVVLKRLPLTANGKVDRGALPAPEEEDYQRGGYVAPRTELERRLCAIWEELLGVERVGIEDGFFHLGGHSLLATRMVSRVRAELGRELPLRTLFEHPTIGALCERLPELNGGWVLPPIEVVKERERLPLSYAQQRLWFIDRLEGGSSQYNIAGAARLRGGLDQQAFAAALRTIVDRHESLRTVFQEAEDGVRQVIRGAVDVPVPLCDLSRLGSEEREREAGLLALEEARRPFDLSRDLMLRVRLLRLAGAEHMVLFNMHHIASDGWSMGVLMKELGALYETYRAGDASPLPPLRVQYADYAQWQRQWLQGERLYGELGYWRRQLNGLPAVHSLPLDRPRPAQQGFEGGEHAQRIPGGQRDAIAALCRSAGSTVFMFLQAAFAVLLSRYSREKDIAVGSPIAGRVHRDLEPLIGFFVNTLVLRSDLSAEPRFTELLEAGKQTILEAHAHQHVPFEMLVEDLKPERSLSHSPLFQILFALQNNERGDWGLGTSRFEPVGGATGIMKFDLELYALENEDGLALSWWFKKELFDPGTVARMASSFGVLVEGILAQPEGLAQALPLLSEAERRQLCAWHARTASYPRDRRIHELFEAQAERAPEAVAVVLGEARLTYGELNERANRVAHLLIAQGVRPETLVGLCTERSLEMVAGILGILKAGGAYVPLDPEYPEERLRTMVEDAALAVVLTQRRLAGLDCFAGLRTVALDDPALETAGGNPCNPASPGRAGDLAYVIYTSGSTGRPKGVMVEHRSVVRLVIDPDFVPLSAETVMLQASSISFDAATLEIWGPLLNGGRLVLYPERVPETGRLNAEIERHGVNTMWLTAGLFEQWSHELPAATPLRWVLSGGDVVDPSAVARMYAAFPGVEVVNGYGPTENTTFTSCHPIPRGFDPRHALPLGRPIHGTGVYVLQEDRTLAALGAVGELCALGDGVARGYLNRPDLTAERFLTDPYAEEGTVARLYRTGDLARWRADGTLEFLGRRDGQVKIRGFRVELGEIEAQLRLEPSVREAAVVLREDRPGQKRLVAYVVGDGGHDPEAAMLRRHLASHLPEHMVPSAFVTLGSLPLTPNGKVDRAALPAPEMGGQEHGAYVAPRTELERRLCEIWAELLGLERVGIEESFFELGGHSLLATQVVSRVRSVLGKELPLRALFEHPTIGGLCAVLPELGGGWVLPAIEVSAEREGLPLSYAQQRLWFIDRLEDGSSQYNIPGAMRVRGDLDVAAFAGALQTIVERHESLRTVFQEVNGEVVQVIREGVELRLAEIDLSGLEGEERAREAGRLAAEDAHKPFDLSRDLMLRAGLLKLGMEEHVVLLNMHHIASDGWSIGVLTRELGALYEAYAAGQDSPLAPLRVQYADYARWQRQWLSGEVLSGELSYWRRELAGLPLVHGLPLDRPRPVRQGFAGGEQTQRLTRVVRDRIDAFCRKRGVTLFMLLEAAFAVLVSRYSQERDIVLGSPIAGRVHRDVEPLIGFFVNTLVLRSDLSANPRFADLLESSKQTILDAYAHQHVPFEMLVEELRPERSLSHSPLFQVLFALQNAEQGEVRLGGLRLEPMGGASGIVKFDLELSAEELADGLVVHWSFKKELFDGTTIARMVSGFGELLAGLLARPEERVEELPLLTEEEREQVLVEWNDTADLEDGAPFHCQFESWAALAPTAPALWFQGAEVTYGDLNRRANQLARFLTRWGIGRGAPVALCMERSVEVLVGLLAILKAGGVYVPLDPSYPDSRLAWMRADSQSTVLLSLKGQAGGLRADVRTLDLDAEWSEVAGEPGENMGCGVGGSDLAYIIYTSGSTGRPKGVAIPHRGLSNLAAAQREVFRLSPASRVLQFASLSFDASIFDFTMGLANGGCLCLAVREELLPGSGLVEVMCRSAVTHATLSPSVVAVLEPADLPDLTTLAVAGEACPAELVARWAPGRRLLNCYGPTETTVWGTYQECRPGKGRPTIGRAILNAAAYVLDACRQPLPAGVSGELFLGGPGVGRGYVGRPELTAERFLPDPFSGEPGARLYRTGDLVRWLADGALDFQGRLDHQVKIRGFRIELGEIEASLAAHPEVQEAIVLAREDQPGNKRLVAYVTGNAKASGLSEYLRGRLPDYMVPSAFVVLEALPLTANGKVDRRALLATEGKNDPWREHVAPATEMERRLCEIWQEVLGMERVSVEDSFFDLGGHSLLVVKLVSRINGCFGIRLSPRHLFESSSVRRLAAVIEGFAAAAPGAWEPLVALSGEPGLPRLYCVPGAGMFSVAMAPLARALAGRMALHVLEARGLDGISPPQTSLDEIVESYGSAIKQRQPQGPYHLAGHSFGGCIAFELARWLEARGDRASIVLLDSFLDYFGSGEAEASPVPAAIEVEDEPANGQSELPGFREVFRSQLEMQRRYRPSGRVQAPITLLHAEDGLMAGDRLAGVLARYDRVAELPVRSFAVRGGHHSMLSGENAMHLAEKILELIGQPAVPEVSEVL